MLGETKARNLPSILAFQGSEETKIAKHNYHWALKTLSLIIWKPASRPLICLLPRQLIFDFLCIEPYGDPSLLGFFLSGSPLFLIFCPLGSLSALGFYDFRLQSAVLWFIDDATSLWPSSVQALGRAPRRTWVPGHPVLPPQAEPPPSPPRRPSQFLLLFLRLGGEGGWRDRES